ncbi:MAG: lycopene cyclase domain-containing protein [Candidatus Promineifilaceae bacterium]
MSYFNFLTIFLLIPIAILLGLAWWDRARGRQIPAAMRALAPAAAIALHVVIALLYTTIWDNYLVATRVWWYDPALVTGLTIAYVPIEEYTFFILQPILAGLWLLFLLRRPSLSGDPVRGAAPVGLRLWSVLITAVLWLVSLIVLLGGWQPGIYIGLELAWALPPIALQLAFGADILWRYRRLVILAIIPLTLYLSAADALAIHGGIWTINPDKSLNLLLGGILPVEEFLFFLLTNTLVTFGMTLVLARAGHRRFAGIRWWMKARHGDKTGSEPTKALPDAR